MQTFRIAILGATGIVGQTLLNILQERKFPVAEIFPLASQAGKSVNFGNKSLPVIAASEFDFSRADIGLFSAGSDISEIYAPKAAAAGCVVIDNTACFRYDDDVPLVIPEINPHTLTDKPARGIIANPNCSTIQMLLALKPIYDRVGILRVNVATYQAVSGSGLAAMSELQGQVDDYLHHQKMVPQIYPVPIAFNVIPHIDIFLENGYSKEEMKMHWETQKILEDKSIQVNATTVRVPVMNGHSLAVHIETRDKITAAEAQQCLAAAPGVVVVDERQGKYPTALTHADGHDAVYVGRIREDFTHPRGLNFWCVADNLRKGAALNAIQIAERLIA